MKTIIDSKIRMLLLISMILYVSLGAFGQNEGYGSTTEQDALKCATKLLAAYYPSDELCVSDSIYDLDWFYFADVVNEKTKQELTDYRVKNNFTWEPPVYSPTLSELFGTYTYKCSQNKYVAQFSAPYNNLIRCDIMPTDGKIGIYGSPTIITFLFIFNDQGKVNQMFRKELHID